MQCANTTALNKMLDSQELEEKSLSSFVANTFDIREEIENNIKFLLDMSKDYQGFDFTEDTKDFIKELIWS